MKTIRTALLFLVLFTLLTGLFYPLLVTGIGRLAFPGKSAGGMILRDGKICGSQLIAQEFRSPRYFHSRPSSTGYLAIPSGGSNLGPSSAILRKETESRRLQFIRENQLDSLCKVPSEMLCASASGLDPDISPASALLQANRVASARNFTPLQRQELRTLIDSMTKGASFLYPGESRINVLLLNLETDKIR